jgi:hypothetical protein
MDSGGGMAARTDAALGVGLALRLFGRGVSGAVAGAMMLVTAGSGGAGAGSAPAITGQAPAKLAPGALPAGCAETPELQNLILPDGSLADVKILQFGEARLYMPTRWIAQYLHNDSEPVDQFIPPFWEQPCPGVVHVNNPEGHDRDGRSSLGIIDLRGRDPARAWDKRLPALTATDQLSFIMLAPDIPNPGDRLKAFYWRCLTLPKVRVVSGLLVCLYIYNPPPGPGLPQPEIKSPAVEDLIRWLALPPNRRDNNREFVLSVEKP